MNTQYSDEERSHDCKSQRTESFDLDSAEGRDIVLCIRGGMARPTPPPLGLSPNRARQSGGNPFDDTSNPATATGKITNQLTVPFTTRSSDTKKPPQPPNCTGAPGTTKPTSQLADVLPIRTSTQAPPLPESGWSTEDADIVRIFVELEGMVADWVSECLPDTLPADFQTRNPEVYWELCGWCEPMTLGRDALASPALARHLLQSWAWRFLDVMIFQVNSTSWACYDQIKQMGPWGEKVRENTVLLFDPTDSQTAHVKRQAFLDLRSITVNHVRAHAEAQGTDVGAQVVAGLAREFLAAFYPYFSEAYGPIHDAQNLEVLIRDTAYMIWKAVDLDVKMRTAGCVYELITGQEGKVCQVAGFATPVLEKYVAPGSTRSGNGQVLTDHTKIGLIVVPGLSKLSLSTHGAVGSRLTRAVVLNGKALEQADLQCSSDQECLDPA